MEKPFIGFYGGEPLLAFSLIRKIVEYAETVFLGKEIKFFITTNATLLTEEISKFLLDHNFRVTFSIDGPKKVHDQNRIFPDGRGTFDKVMENTTMMCDMDKQNLSNESIKVDSLYDDV